LTLNRPEAMNALRTSLLRKLSDAITTAAQDAEVRVVVVTGGAQVFAAGADIKELAGKGPLDVLTDERIGMWQRIAAFDKPPIARELARDGKIRVKAIGASRVR